MSTDTALQDIGFERNPKKITSGLQYNFTVTLAHARKRQDNSMETSSWEQSGEERNMSPSYVFNQEKGYLSKKSKQLQILDLNLSLSSVSKPQGHLSALFSNKLLV